MADVQVTFGAELAGLQRGVNDAKQIISGGLTPVVDEFGDLSARQVGSIVGLFNRLGGAAGVALGPIGAMSIELVRASQHFTEFKHTGEALGAIRETIMQAITNPLTLAIGGLVAAGFAAKFLYDTLSGPSAEEVQEKLRGMSALIKEIGERWSVAGDLAAKAMEKTDAALQRGLASSLRNAQRILQSEMAKIQVSLGNALADIIREQADRGASKETLAMLRNFSIDAAQGTIDILKLRDALDQLGLAKSADTTLNDMIDKTETLAQTAIQAAAAVKALSVETGAVEQATSGSVRTGFGGFQSWDSDEAIQKLIKGFGTPTKPNDVVGGAIGDLQRQTAAIEAQAKALGMAHQEAVAYVAEQNVMALAAQAGVQVTDQQAAAVKKWAAELAAATVNMEKINAQQQAFGNIAHQITGAFSAWMSGTDSLTHALLLMTLQLAQAVVEALIFDAIMKGLGIIFPGAGPVVGFLGKVFGGGRAEGGPLESGKWYIAGERGPEPVWGGGPGAFAAPNAGGGGGSDFMEAMLDRFVSKMLPVMRRMAGSSGRMSNTAHELMNRIR